MGCLTVILRKVNSTLSGMDRIGGIEASASRVGGVEAEFEKRGGVTVSAERRGGISVGMGLVCGTSLGAYDVLWASDGPLLTVENGYLITK